ncbi:MAG: hypothetical protein ABI554_12195 [Flavobacterium sp.]
MAAVRLPQHRHCAPRKTIISAIATIIIFCGAWGRMIADYITTSQNRISTTFYGLKK